MSGFLTITHLLAVLDLLGKDAVLVANTIAVGSHAQRGHGVKEASGEAAQATVAQAGVLLEGLQLLNVQAQLVERLVTRGLDAQVDHGVGQRATHVVLQRQVVHTLRNKEWMVNNTNKEKMY